MSIITSIIVIVIIVLAIFIYWYLNTNRPFENVWGSFSDKRKALDLLDKMSDICDENKLEFFAVYGTLLGSLRHGGFIPWDDDIDVLMSEEDFEVFKENIDEDHRVIKVKDFYKFYKKSGERPFLKEYEWPFVDIFVFKVEETDKEGKIILFRDEKSIEESYRYRDVFPLKEVSFEDTKIKIPRKSKAILDKYFGKDWKDVCISSEYNHRTGLFQMAVKDNCKSVCDRFEYKLKSEAHS